MIIETTWKGRGYESKIEIDGIERGGRYSMNFFAVDIYYIAESPKVAMFMCAIASLIVLVHRGKTSIAGIFPLRHFPHTDPPTLWIFRETLELKDWNSRMHKI